MTSERIKEIQQQTAYPDSISVQQALLQVWNECEQLPQQEISEKPINLEISDEQIEFTATNAWVEFNKKDSDDSESFYKGWELAIKWYREQLKQNL